MWAEKSCPRLAYRFLISCDGRVRRQQNGVIRVKSDCALDIVSGRGGGPPLIERTELSFRGVPVGGKGHWTKTGSGAQRHCQDVCLES